jgi:hypothetical protein
VVSSSNSSQDVEASIGGAGLEAAAMATGGPGWVRCAKKMKQQRMQMPDGYLKQRRMKLKTAQAPGHMAQLRSVGTRVALAHMCLVRSSKVSVGWRAVGRKAAAKDLETSSGASDEGAVVEFRCL